MSKFRSYSVLVLKIMIVLVLVLVNERVRVIVLVLVHEYITAKEPTSLIRLSPLNADHQ
jgi:hypothetical protein